MQTGFELKSDGYFYAPPIDPVDELDYTLDFTEILGSDVIVTAIYASVGGTLQTVPSKATFTDKTATVWLKSGTSGQVSTVTITVYTLGTRTIERSFKMNCVQR